MLDDVTLSEGPECVNFYGHLAVCSVGTVAPGATVQRAFTFNDLKTGELRLQGNASSDQARRQARRQRRQGERPGRAARGPQARPRHRPEAAPRAGATLVASVRNSAAGSARGTKLQLDIAKGLQRRRPA